MVRFCTGYFSIEDEEHPGDQWKKTLGDQPEPENKKVHPVHEIGLAAKYVAESLKISRERVDHILTNRRERFQRNRSPNVSMITRNMNVC